MYEHEKVADGITPTQKNFRGSSYLSFSLYPTDNITIVSTTYYQPNFEVFSDYRISTQNSLVVQLVSNLGLNISWNFIYDTVPAVGIPKSQYDFSTGTRLVISGLSQSRNETKSKVPPNTATTGRMKSLLR